jgi:hypothetical protein
MDERGGLSRDQVQDHVVVAAGQGAHVGDGVGADDRHGVAQQPIRERLQPQLARGRRQRPVEVHDFEGQDPPAPALPQRIQTRVGGDPVQPGPQRRAGIDPSMARQARSKVSSTRSSASWNNPSMR